MNSPREFYENMVSPTLLEFDAEYHCLRRAFLAVAVIDAFAAQIYAYAKDKDIDPFSLLGWCYEGGTKSKDDSAFRHRIAENCTGFKIIRDVAKANKHAVLTRGKPLVNRSDQIVSKPKGYGLGRYSEGRFGGVAQIVVELDSGEEIYLEHQLLEAREMLVDLVELLEERVNSSKGQQT